MVWPWKIKDNAIESNNCKCKIIVGLNVTTRGPLLILFNSGLFCLEKQILFRYSATTSSCCIWQGYTLIFLSVTVLEYLHGMSISKLWPWSGSSSAPIASRLLGHWLPRPFKHPQWWLLSSVKGEFDFRKQPKVLLSLSLVIKLYGDDLVKKKNNKFLWR